MNFTPETTATPATPHSQPPPKVTVAVPVYNIASQLPKCLDSLAAQTLPDIEFLLIDDGSKDASGQICDEYARRDPRFKVFHKPNGGLASARKVGLERATGEYYIVCDGDDWVAPTMYEALYTKAKAEDADMVICDFYYNYPHKRPVVGRACRALPQSALLHLTLTGVLHASMWCKLVRRSLFADFGITYEDGINTYEDLLLLVKFYLHPLRLSFVNEPLYQYRREMNGASYGNNITFKNLQNIAFVDNWLKENAFPSRANAEAASVMKIFFLRDISFAFYCIRCEELPANYYREQVLSHLPLCKFVRYRAFGMKPFLILSTKLFGYSFGKAIYRLLYRYVYK